MSLEHAPRAKPLVCIGLKVDLGITVGSVLQNTRGSTLGKGRAHYSENKSARSKSREFLQNSREAVSVSTICDEYSYSS